MKSRITIEVNFDEGNLPVIQVLSQSSDDVRDKLIQSFLQSLQHTSRWCKILYKGNRSQFAPPLDFNENAVHCWHIVPIRPSEIPEEIKLMDATFEKPNKIETALPSRWQIGDNCAFATEDELQMAWEKAKKENPYKKEDEIEYTPNYKWGKVVAIKFTTAKVFYDCIDDVENKVYENIPSHHVKNISEEISA